MNKFGDAPVGWTHSSLSSLARYCNGAAFAPGDWEQEGLPIIRIEQINDPASPTDCYPGSVLPDHLINDGDLIFSWSATLKVVIWSGGRGVLNQHLFKVLPKPHIDLSFLKHLLDGNMENIAAGAHGSTMKHITRKELDRYKVHLPSNRKEQVSIAEFLSTVDVAIENAETLIVKLNRIKAGLMHDLFTRGVMPDGRLRPTHAIAPALYSQSQVGWIPNGWVLAPIGTKVKVLDPNPSHRYPSEVSVGVPICSTENFVGEDDFDLERSKQMPDFVFGEQVTRCGFDPDDVVFARKGRVGLARRYGQERKTFSHTVVILKSGSPQVSQRWLLWFSRSRGLLGAIEREMNTNLGVPTLGIGTIQRIIRPFPPISEQRQVSVALDQASKTIRAETSELQKLQRLKIGLMQDLLTGRVRVQVPDIAEGIA